MPLKKGAKNLTIRPSIIAKLEQKHEERRKSNPMTTPEKLGTFANDLVETWLEKDEFIAKRCPHFEFIGIQDNVMYIKDIRGSGKNKTADIYLKDSDLYCALDSTDDCDHIHYALMRPEVAKLQSIKRPR